MAGISRLQVVFVLIFSFTALAFCAENISSSASAISAAAGLKGVPEKVTYLLTQAKTLYNSQKFQEVVNIAQYILTNLDPNSWSAKSLLTKAKQQLFSLAQQKATELKGGISAFNLTAPRP